MKIEKEVKILEIDKEVFEKQLIKLGAKKESEGFQKRYTYDFIPEIPNKWIRLRSRNGKTALTIKEVLSKTISGTREWEIEVSDFDETDRILNELGYKYRNYQENYRTIYKLKGLEIAIDEWPLIPIYAEIEGDNEEEIQELVKKLKVRQDKITTLDVQSVYKDIYAIDVLKIRDLKIEDK